MKSVSLLIVSFGSEHWRELAAQRAMLSAQAQGNHEIILLHDADPNASLAKLRNRAAAAATGEYLIFVDADDELESNYVEAMREISSDVRVPMVRILGGDPYGEVNQVPDAIEIERRHLLDGNYIVIGAAVRRELFLDVGGFDDHATIEDWPLWIKCWIQRASIELAPNAIYRQNWRLGSRNQMERRQYLKIYESIREHYTSLAREKGLI